MFKDLLNGTRTPGSNSDASNRRRMGRLLCDDLRSSLGEVVDLSATGMRVRVSGKPPQADVVAIPVTLVHHEETLTLMARVAWVQKDGWFKHAVGLEFVNLTDSQRTELAALARVARSRLVIDRRAV